MSLMITWKMREFVCAYTGLLKQQTATIHQLCICKDEELCQGLYLEAVTQRVFCFASVNLGVVTQTHRKI